MQFKNLFILAILLITFSCQQDTNLGEELLQNELIELSHKNDFEITARSYKAKDPIGFLFNTDSFGFTTFITTNVAFIGTVDDPMFGKVSSDFYTRIVYNPNVSVPSFTSYILDSAVLVLAYDTLNYYGNQGISHTVKVYEVTEDFKDVDTLYTNKSLATNSSVIGEKTFIPAPKDSITIKSHTDTSDLKVPAQIRVRMSQQWAESLIRNPLIATAPATDAANVLNSVFKGIKITSETLGNGLIPLSMTDATIGSGGINKLNFYFTDGSGSKINYQFYFTRLKYNNVKLDPAGSVAQSFVDNPSESDSLIFVQSMGGISSYIDLKDIINLDGKVINHAELILTVASLPGDNITIFPPIKQLTALKNKADGTKEEIADLSLLTTSQLPITSSFGGDLEENNGVYTYKLNITRHLKELQSETNPDTKIYLEAYDNVNSINRSVIYGPKHSTYPVKLYVALTEK